MALPGDLNTVTVTGTFKDAAGVPQAGTVTFAPNAVLTDSTGNVIVPVSARTYTLTGGAFTSDALCATDNGNISPAGWAYTVTVALANLQPWSFTALIPHTPSTVDISALTPLFPVPAVQAYLPAGGGTLTGPLVLDGSPALQVPSGAAAGEVLTSDSSGNAAWSFGGAKLGYYYLDSYTGSDDAKMASALTALFAASPAGGTIILAPRAHTFANQWATTYSAGVTTALKIQGAGVAFNGTWGTPTAATTCDMQYAGAGAARIDMQHIGTIEITGIMFRDTVSSTVPFLQVTNTTPNIHDVVWAGNASVSGLTCYQDAIVLGGTSTSGNSGDTAPYQGYQGQIYRNFFHRIRRACYFRSAANSAQFHDNTVSITCGSNLYLGACIEFLGPNSSTFCTGNGISGNCIEMQNYPVGVKGTAFTTACTLGPNGFFDGGANTFACYWFDEAGTAKQNEVIDGYHSSALIYDPANANTVRSPLTGQGSYYNTPVSFRNTMLVANGGAGAIGMDSSGNRGAWAAGAGVSLANPSLTAQVTAPTQVTDGSTVSTSNIITSLTAVWTAADIGEPIAGTGINSGTFIQWTYSATTALPWQASTAYTAGQVVRPVSANAHLYQCTTAGTTASSAPTFPTNGTTVSDGTAVWTDIGAATAAVISHNASATGTGVTTTFGRASGSAISMTSFGSHHILSSGSAPTALALTGAGTGATASVAGTDIAHLFTLNTGTSTTAGASVCGATFALPFAAAPHGISIAPGSSSAAALLAGGYWLTTAGTAWSMATTNAPPASTSGLLFFVTVIK